MSPRYESAPKVFLRKECNRRAAGPAMMSMAEQFDSGGGTFPQRILIRDSLASVARIIRVRVALNAETQSSLRSAARRSRTQSDSLSSIGWRRGPGRGGTHCNSTPLPGPLPARSSRGEGRTTRGQHRRSFKCPDPAEEAGHSPGGFQVRTPLGNARRLVFLAAKTRHIELSYENETHY